MTITPKIETIIDDGWYPAKIGTVENKDTQFGERLMVPFEVESGGDMVEITAFLSYSDHPKSNLVRWAKALFGDRPFDTDEYSGVECEVFVELGEDKEGNPKNSVLKVRRRRGDEAPTKADGAEPKPAEEAGSDVYPF